MNQGDTGVTYRTKRIPDVPYGSAGGRVLLLDILRPEPVPDRPIPAIVEIHGGGFYEGERDTERNRLLAEHGFFTVSIDYRHSPEAPFPAQIQDAKAAIRWLRANAEAYHLDPSRIGAWGGSAGGAIAALLGTSSDVLQLEGENGSPGYSSAVQAVVDECGPTDMQGQVRPDMVWVFEQLFGGPVSGREDLVRLANPVTHIRPDCPPFLIVHGEEDDVVPIRNSELLDEALTTAGCQVTFIRVPGGGHSFTDHWDQSMEQIRLRFFQTHLGG